MTTDRELIDKLLFRVQNLEAVVKDLCKDRLDLIAMSSAELKGLPKDTRGTEDKHFLQD